MLALVSPIEILLLNLIAIRVAQWMGGEQPLNEMPIFCYNQLLSPDIEYFQPTFIKLIQQRIFLRISYSLLRLYEHFQGICQIASSWKPLDNTILFHIDNSMEKNRSLSIESLFLLEAGKTQMQKERAKNKTTQQK